MGLQNDQETEAKLRKFNHKTLEQVSGTGAVPNWDG